MRALQILTHGSVDGLAIVELPTPTPAPGELLVRIRAVSLNYRDHLQLSGPRDASLPTLIPCSDGAGEVVAIGAGVSGFDIGERVAANFFPDWIGGPFAARHHLRALGGSAPGMAAEYVALPASAWVKAPAHLGDAETATLPCAAVTAWQALFERGRLKAGQTVLLQGTGGVSLFALQLAKAAGARVILTSSSDEKLAAARERGADALINYRTHPRWSEEVLRLTDGLGVDHVIEVGGPATLGESLASLGAGGQLALIGVLTGFDASPAPLRPLMVANGSIHGIYVGSVEMFRSLNRALEANRIHPVIDRRYTLDEAALAYRHLASGTHIGKIVITLP